jgi:sulfofructose kinase
MATIVCLGIVVRDLVFRVPTLPPQPGKLTASSLQRVGGGMSGSASVAAARLGATVAFWGRLGDDVEGRALRVELESYGVAVPAPAEPGSETPTAAVLVADNGERLLAVYRGDLNDSADWLPLAQLAQVQAVLADFRWPTGAHALFAAARARAIPSVLDADMGDPDGVLGLLPGVEHAVFSEAGLAQAAGHGDVERALQQMHERGPAVVGVTLGERGSVFLLQGVIHRVSAIAVQARDTNGAGDVFHGAYTLALAEGLGVLDAARFASAAAALKCRNGTGWAASPTRADVQHLMKVTP